MAKYLVVIPFGGSLSIEVEANSTEDAIDIAREQATLANVETWETFRDVMCGNVCNFPEPWEIEVEEITP